MFEATCMFNYTKTFRPYFIIDLIIPIKRDNRNTLLLHYHILL